MNVRFRDEFIAEVLNSMVRVFLSFGVALSYAVMLVIFAATSTDKNALSTEHLTIVDAQIRYNYYFRFMFLPLLVLVPLKLRIVQCLLRSIESGKRWPHFFNAMKYSVTAIVVSQALFETSVQRHVSWLICATVVVLFSAIWDIFVDWGLFSISSAGFVTLRKQRRLGGTLVYIAVSGVNFVLRFIWLATLVPEYVVSPDEKAEHQSAAFYLHPVILSLEILRRMVWCVLRVEYEEIAETLGASGSDLTSLHGEDISTMFSRDLQKVCISLTF